MKRPISEADYISSYKKSGDLKLLGTLYKPYMPLVLGVCFKYFKNREESQDAVMQIFEKLIVAVRNHEIKNFKSWLYVLTKNHCLMALRSSKSAATMIEMDGNFMESDLLLHHKDEQLEDDLVKLESCIAKLQTAQKQCVELFYLKRKPYTVIVAQTGYELKKVKSYIQNGKRNLKICMENKNE